MLQFFKNCIDFLKNIWNNLFTKKPKELDNPKDILLPKKDDEVISSITDITESGQEDISFNRGAQSELRHRTPTKPEASNLSLTVIKSNIEIPKPVVYTGTTDEILSKKYLGYVVEEKTKTIKQFFHAATEEI